MRLRGEILRSMAARGKRDFVICNGMGAFRTLRLARDFVEIGLGFWLMGVALGNLARLGNGMLYENTS